MLSNTGFVELNEAEMMETEGGCMLGFLAIALLVCFIGILYEESKNN